VRRPTGTSPPKPWPRPLPRVVLASASPRRRDLLIAAGLTFEVDPADVDEGLEEGTGPEDGAQLLAERKARAVAERWAGQGVLVIGADTIVAVDGPAGPRLLGKPADPMQAREMLAALSGTVHRVVTGVSVIAAGRTGGAAPRRAHTGMERTLVTMRALSPAEIDAYVALGEWAGKAGGYAIQESADAFVTRLEEGGFDNVVGLPVALTRELLERAAAEG
jgi:septum formation protein